MESYHWSSIHCSGKWRCNWVYRMEFFVPLSGRRQWWRERNACPHPPQVIRNVVKLIICSLYRIFFTEIACLQKSVIAIICLLCKVILTEISWFQKCVGTVMCSLYKFVLKEVLCFKRSVIKLIVHSSIKNVQFI